MSERKVPNTFNLTQRQMRAINEEAKRLAVPPAEVVRRVLDAWIDAHPSQPRTLASKVYEGAPR